MLVRASGLFEQYCESMQADPFAYIPPAFTVWAESLRLAFAVLTGSEDLYFGHGCLHLDHAEPAQNNQDGNPDPPAVDEEDEQVVHCELLSSAENKKSRLD
jgi:hypothetical protein